MLRSLAVLLCMALGTTAFAEGPRYNFIEGSYERVEIDDSFGDIDGDGFGIGGSLELSDSFHAFASYGTADFDFNVDLDTLTVGGGYHSPMTDSVDLVAEIAYVQVDASALGFSADDDGFGASIGLRGKTTDRVELEGFVDYVNLDDAGDDTSFRGAAWYAINDSFSVGLQLGFGDDATSYGIGGRVFFD